MVVGAGVAMRVDDGVVCIWVDGAVGNGGGFDGDTSARIQARGWRSNVITVSAIAVSAPTNAAVVDLTEWPFSSRELPSAGYRVRSRSATARPSTQTV